LKFYELQKTEAILLMQFRKMENDLHLSRLLALQEKIKIFQHQSEEDDSKKLIIQKVISKFNILNFTFQQHLIYSLQFKVEN
jgi:hypothetical protein